MKISIRMQILYTLCVSMRFLPSLLCLEFPALPTGHMSTYFLLGFFFFFSDTKSLGLSSWTLKFTKFLQLMPVGGAMPISQGFFNDLQAHLLIEPTTVLWSVQADLSGGADKSGDGREGH